MKMVSNIAGAVVIITAFGLIGCGSGSGTSSGTSSSDTITTVADLPKATSPVSSSSADVSASKSFTEKSLSTTGVKLKTMSSANFSSSSAQAGCEVDNKAKSLYNEAVKGDLILCYIQAMEPSFREQFPSVDFYDGKPHILNLTGAGDKGSFRVKMQVTKDSSGAITDFSMWSCTSGVQTEYLNQSIANGNFSMTSRYTYDDTFGTGGGDTTVTGALSGKNFTSKTINNTNTYTQTNGTGHSQRTLVQRADSFDISGYETGTWSFENNTGTYTQQACATAELLNSDKVATLAVGSGAAKYTVGGSDFNGHSYSETNTQGWNGDSTEAESNSFSQNLSCTVPDVDATAPTITFTGAAAYDCDGTGALDFTIDGTAIEAKCSDLTFGWEWVSCWDIIKNDKSNDN